MPDQPSFSLPENPHPETYRCIVVPVPDDIVYVQVFSGLLNQLAQWFNWQRDDARTGKECAQEWREIYDEIDWTGNMGKCGCCAVPPPPPRFRFTTGGVYQISIDNGVTWNDAPEYDYRNNSALYPSIADQGITSTKCANADAVRAVIQKQIVEEVANTTGAASILALITTVLLTFLTAGSYALFAAAAPGLVGGILAVGVAAVNAAFTTEVWHKFLCLVYNNMDTDDSISEASLPTLLQGVHDKFEGIVNIILTNIINASGSVGLTNMMRSSQGDIDANCDDCEGCANPFPTVPPGGGTINDVGGRFINITSAFDGGLQAVYLWFDNTTGIFDPSKCGIVAFEQFTGSSAVQRGWNDCGTGTEHVGNWPTGTCAAQFYWRSATSFTLALETCVCE